MIHNTPSFHLPVYQFDGTTEVLSFKNQDILILFPSAPKEEQMAFFSNVLKAVHLTEKDYEMALLLENITYTLSPPLAPSKASRKLIAFGVEPEQLSWRIHSSPYQIFSFLSILGFFAPSLQFIASDQSQKRLLWQALQSLFADRIAPEV